MVLVYKGAAQIAPSVQEIWQTFAQTLHRCNYLLQMYLVLLAEYEISHIESQNWQLTWGPSPYQFQQ